MSRFYFNMRFKSCCMWTKFKHLNKKMTKKSSKPRLFIWLLLSAIEIKQIIRKYKACEKDYVLRCNVVFYTLYAIFVLFVYQ